MYFCAISSGESYGGCGPGKPIARNSGRSAFFIWCGSSASPYHRRSCLDVCRPSSSGPLKKLAKIRKQGALEISTYLLAMKVNVDEVQQRLVVTLMV